MTLRLEPFTIPAPRPRCSSGKNEYSSRGDARRALAIHQTNGGAVRSVYRCPECRYYHLTKRPRG